ncbi:MAG: cytochrome P450, partial [Proteobacteria bacterium]|nr:cytochrome P450 [Pseudomonadota bacterium]
MPTTAHDFRRPPGPDSAVALGIDPATLGILQKLQREYGDIVSIEKPSGRLAYFINDPAEVRRILVRRHTRYVKGPGFERVKMLLGNGLIVSDGDVWRRSRTMIQPAFKVQNVHRLMRVMVQCTERRAAAWAKAIENNELINITRETSEFALELILITIFGSDYENKIMASGENPFAFLSRDSTRDLSVVMKVRDLRKMLLAIIAERRDRDVDEFDFLSMYMQATDKSGVHFTNKELLDELMTLIVAGFETSANTLNWAWYLIAGHPEVEAKLIAEAKASLPSVAAVPAGPRSSIPRRRVTRRRKINSMSHPSNCCRRFRYSAKPDPTRSGSMINMLSASSIHCQGSTGTGNTDSITARISISSSGGAPTAGPTVNTVGVT